MAINGHVISGSDPGAVPGASTKSSSKPVGFCGGEIRIDERVKVTPFARHGATVIGAIIIVANDNYEGEVALAA